MGEFKHKKLKVWQTARELEFIHFLVIARGSLSEVDTQLTLAEDLGYTTYSDSLQNDIENLSRQISNLVTHLRKKQQLSKPPTL